MAVKMPLRCRILKGVLTITVGADTVKFATENHPTFFNEEGENTLEVADKSEWLRSVVSRINSEEEDGSTLLTKMLDDAIAEAVEQGEEGLRDEP
jgi:hypothetical protein